MTKIRSYIAFWKAYLKENPSMILMILLDIWLFIHDVRLLIHR